MNRRSLRLFVPALAAYACAPGADASSYDAAAANPAAATIESINILRHVRTLASDDYEGRAPASPGEQRTTDYIIGEFRRLGLEPGSPDGSWLQAVHLRGLRGTSSARFAVNGRTVSFRIPQDVLVRVVSPDSQVVITNSDIVFVGYGIVAPDIGWDDYAGLDVRGKSVVVLPGEPSPSVLARAGRRDTMIFRGRERSFHGTTRGKRGSGGEILGKPIGYLRRMDDDYGAHDYHGLTDEVHHDWDLEGDAELARFNFLVGLRVAQGMQRPSWKTGAEFKAVRDSMLDNRTARLP